MKPRSDLAAFALAIGLLAAPFGTAEAAPQMKMATETPEEILTPDSVETRLGTLKFKDGFPDEATTQTIYDNLDFQRGVEAFLNAMPGGSTEAIRKGFASMGADDNQTVLIMEELMDSKSLFLTPNTESIYNMMWLDLKEGPLVFETPPNVNQTRSMLQTDQRLPSIGSNTKDIVVNPDSSVDVWFGPTAPEGHESNWVQTVAGKGWNVLLRLYGPGEAWFDKSWKPGEFELVK